MFSSYTSPRAGGTKSASTEEIRDQLGLLTLHAILKQKGTSFSDATEAKCTQTVWP